MEKSQLQHLIQESISKLEVLKEIEYDGLKESITELESTLNEFKESGEKLLTEDNVLQIGIVGQVKAGKSSFLNSLFFEGENVLPKASTPMTAGLTIIEYAEDNTFEVDYFTRKDWEIFENQHVEYQKCERKIKEQNQGKPEIEIKHILKESISEKIRSAYEMVSTCSDRAKQKIGGEKDVRGFSNISDLQKVLEQYVGANGEYTSVVKSLYIKMNDDRLKGLRIVDTPGVNDPVVSRENRTRMFLQSCHGVFLLSASTDFMGSGDVGFLNSRIGSSGISSVVLLASKFDSVLQDLGADREMKGQEHADLVDTVDDQKKKFKRRLRELSDTINDRIRERIKIDTTAGIGYSIAHKPKEKWDDIETQVVAQMSRYYPEYFDTDENIKESFEGLANMSDIRGKYLDGEFMAKKETIIAEKLRDFFAKHKEEISSTIRRILDEYKNRQEQLNETTLAEIQKQKNIQSKLFEELEDDFSHIFSQFRDSLQQEVMGINNRIILDDISIIPTEKTCDSITHKGWLWGHNTNEIEYEQINTFELAEQIKSTVDSYAKSWADEWNKLLEKKCTEMSETLCAKISEFELSIMSTSFKDTYYRNLIYKVLDKIRNFRVLAIGDMIAKYKRQGDDIANEQYYPSGTDELEKEQVASHLKNQLREHKSKLTIDIRTLIDSLKTDTDTEVKNNLKGASEEVEKMKSSFAKNLKKEGEEYLTKLEHDLAEKTDVLKQMESIVNCLTELEVLYK